MRVLRLFWAGVQIETGGATLVIDLLEHVAPLRSFLGDPQLPVVFGPEILDVALVTHLHPDHYDPDSLRQKLRSNARVICDPANVARINQDGLPGVGATLYEPISVEPFTVTALPAADGVGDPQISFLVEADGVKLMHFGDTLWHGHWWKIRERCGAPDVAFLPINGVIAQLPGMEPTGIPIDLMPDQAAAAAALLGTKIACPIHYGAFHNPPLYVEVPNAVETFRTASHRLGVVSRTVEPGSEVVTV